MLTINDVIGAINDEIVKAYPGDMVYVNLIPKDFERPSFLLMLESFNQTDANRTTVSIEMSVSITCYIKIDGHYNIETSALADRVDTVRSIFSSGYLSVIDRCIGVTIPDGGVDFTEGIIVLAFDYFDERPMPCDETPPIESVRTNITKEDI